MRQLFAALLCCQIYGTQTNMLSDAPVPIPLNAVTCQLGWPDDYFSKLPPKLEAYAEVLDMGLVYWGEKPVQLDLQEIGPDFLSTLPSNRYAIVGRYSDSKMVPGSSLEMLSFFARKNPGDFMKVYTSSRPLVCDSTPENSPKEIIWHTFVIPFDKTKAKTHLDRVVLRLHLAGGYGSKLGFDQVYLVGYPPNVPFPLPPETNIPSVQPSFLTVAPVEAISKKNVPTAQHPEAVLQLRTEAGSVIGAMDGHSFTMAELDTAVKERFNADPGTQFVVRGADHIAYSDAEKINTILLRRTSNLYWITDNCQGTFTAVEWTRDHPVNGFLAHASDLSWSSFAAGIITTFATIGIVTGLFAFARRFRFLRHQRELRRIASLDG